MHVYVIIMHERLTGSTKGIKRRRGAVGSAS